MTAIRQAALDLLHRGGCSVPMLGGELVRRGLVTKDQSINEAYRLAREALDGLVAEKKAQKWECGYVYTIPAGKAESKDA